MRSILAILTIACAHLHGAINADIIINWNGARGVIPAGNPLSTLNAGTIGSYSFWQLSGDADGTPGRSFIQASDLPYALTVNLGGTNYNVGSGTNCFMQLAQTNLSQEGILLAFADGPTNAVLGMFVKMAMTNTASGTNIDFAIWYGTAAAYGVFHGQPANGVSYVGAHADGDNGFSSDQIVAAKWYFLLFQRDNGGAIRVWILDPANGYTVTSSHTAVLSNFGGTQRLEFKIGYLGNMGGAIYWGGGFIQKDTTASGFFELLAQIQGPTAHTIARGNVTMRGKSVLR